MTNTDQGVKAPETKVEDPAPELKVVPIEDLDKVEKLLDVAINTINMPNLPNIKAACMQELVEIDAAMGEQMAVAQAEHQKALDEWSAKRNAERAAKEKERLAAEKKKADELRAKAEKEGVPVERDSWTPPRDTMAHPQPVEPIDRRV
jgi:hypothetical protein